jgi:small subunit ribosomal protein S29
VKALTAAFTFANQSKGATEDGDGKRRAKKPARRLLARASDDALREAIDSYKRVDVRGSRGSGKSVALAQLVMRARADGWIVAYVPDGLELTRLSYFSKSTKEGCDGLWETPDCAMRFLKHIANAANESVLTSIKVEGVTLKDENALKKNRGKKSKEVAEADAEPKAGANVNLFEYAKAGSKTPEMAVDCALLVMNELRALAKRGDGKVMFVVDQYNALFGPSDMHEVTGPRSRKNIPAKNLRLVRAVIEIVDAACDEDAGHVAVTAASESVGVSKSTTEQSRADESSSNTIAVNTPRFSTDEIATILREYKAVGIVKAVVDEQTVAAMKALTNGNPREIQSISSTLLR